MKNAIWFENLHRKILTSAVCGLLGLTSLPAHSTPVTLNWTGTIDSATGSMLGDIGSPTVGTTISGTFLYDTASLPADNIDLATQSRFQAGFYDSASFTIGGVTTSLTPSYDPIFSTIRKSDEITTQDFGSAPNDSSTFFSVIDRRAGTINSPPGQNLTDRTLGIFLINRRPGSSGPDFNAEPFNWDWTAPTAEEIANNPTSIAPQNFFWIESFFNTLSATGSVTDVRYDIEITLTAASSSFVLPDVEIPQTILFGQTATIADGEIFDNADVLTIAGTLVNNGDLFNSGGLIEVIDTGSIEGTGKLQQSGGSIIVNGTVNQDVSLTGGTLSGAGTINGDVVVDESEFTPGNSPGTLVINGDLLVAAGSIIQLELGDLIEVSGNLVIEDGALVELLLGDQSLVEVDISDFFDVQEMSTFAATAIRVFSTTAGGSVDLSFGSDDLGSRAIEDVSQATVVNVLVGIDLPNSSVPLPSTFPLLLVGFLGASAVARHRRRLFHAER